MFKSGYNKSRNAKQRCNKLFLSLIKINGYVYEYSAEKAFDEKLKKRRIEPGGSRSSGVFMRQDCGNKAAGGISSLEDAEKFIALGASRLGTSRIVKLAKAMEQN